MSNENEVVTQDEDGVIADVLNGVEGAIQNKNILELPVRIVVSVGGAQISVRDLIDLKPDTVIDLEAGIDDPVEIFVGERLIARGALVEATDNENGIGVRLVEICGIGG